MFYPVNSLKRGGRFYLCWVADSWPQQFANITHRQLWSQDIRQICDDLLEVMTNESGRPANRFSLRLSSQLLRGLVRLYQRKVSVLLGDLCMVNASVIKNTNKKWIIHESPAQMENVQRPRLQIIIQEPEDEQRVEVLIQKSNNTVANIDEITLKEPIMPENLLVNDGFGELHIDQQIADRTMELMMLGDLSAIQHSVLDLPADFSTDKSHDKSKLTTHDAQMETISEHDITMFRKSVGTDLVPVGDFEKEIPEIPEIPPPDLKTPHPMAQTVEQQGMDISDIRKPPKDVPTEATIDTPDKEIVLEELEDVEPQAKRRRQQKLIIDKKTKLSTEYLRARIDNVAVELRCQDSSEDVMNIRVHADTYLSRPAHAGQKIRSNLPQVFSERFLRNLRVLNRTPMADREMEEAVTKPRTRQTHTRSQLETIGEEVRQPHEPPQVEVPMQMEVNVAKELNIEQLGFAEIPTQRVETLSQHAAKLAGEFQVPAKIRRTMGHVSYRHNQELVIEAAIPAHDAEKENIPQNRQLPSIELERSVTAMLQEAGLTDMLPYKPTEVKPRTGASLKISVRNNGSETSETPLGSLDRTKVSLGDSEQTTDSNRFIRDQWGIEGTMIKILESIKKGTRPLNINNLIKEHTLPGKRNIIAARCFSSVLKLKQHGFIEVRKDPQTLEITDILLGPRFKQ
ncbi:unnamed protein product [Parnassius apollo]|uniref:(apollo) hypothetical protein n=1 Tax=Parnassius apollo TaxID=110799 RepID=A0A8S3WVP2_PARAO|nr:unnamed protein product [Parnassius apollo]